MASKPATTADKVLSTDDKERIMKMLEDDDEFEEFETHGKPIFEVNFDRLGC